MTPAQRQKIERIAVEFARALIEAVEISHGEHGTAASARRFPIFLPSFALRDSNGTLRDNAPQILGIFCAKGGT